MHNNWTSVSYSEKAFSLAQIRLLYAYCVNDWSRSSKHLLDIISAASDLASPPWIMASSTSSWSVFCGNFSQWHYFSKTRPSFSAGKFYQKVERLTEGFKPRSSACKDANGNLVTDPQGSNGSGRDLMDLAGVWWQNEV